MLSHSGRITFRAFSVAVAALAAACSTSRLPDAPKTAPHYKIGAPYEVEGKRYIPREEPAYEAVGIASWYGDAFDGKPTANGEIFDKRRLSAAHPTLPLPSLVEVENLENGRRATVRVNDRGPFVGDRLIDLSHAAAIALGFDGQGLARVKVRYVGRADLLARAPVKGDLKIETSPLRAQAPRPALAAPVAVSPVAFPAAADAMESLIQTAIDAPVAASGEFWVAVAEFDDPDEIESQTPRLTASEEARVVMSTQGARVVYGLQIGPYASLAAAQARLADFSKAGYSDAWIARNEAAAELRD